jgi:nitrite reductase (NO-forming)
LIDLGPMPSGGRPAAAAGRQPRLTERHVLALGLGVSAAFVAAAGIAAGLSVASGGTSWSALHLAMAGAATVAIGAVMPHFAVTLAGTRPSPAIGRLATIGALAIGAVGVVVGVGFRLPSLTALATLLVVVGLGGVAMQILAPSRNPLARRHPVVTVAYGVALADLAAGVVIGGLGATGLEPALDAWARLRPAHAWLALFGGVSLTIAATLVYLGPTVLGARIRAGWSLALMIVGIGVGPIVAAVGFVAGAPVVVATGMALTAGGAVGQVGYVVDARRRRGRFTSEHDWRRVAIGHLAAGTAWFLVASTVALVDLAAGRAIAGWSIGMLALPLVAGWMLQELVGSWTHLVPSVTPGGPEDHARQRRVLAAGSRTRLATWNAGLLAAVCGAWLDLPVVAGIGTLALVGAIGVSVLLLGRSLTIGRY